MVLAPTIAGLTPITKRGSLSLDYRWHSFKELLPGIHACEHLFMSWRQGAAAEADYHPGLFGPPKEAAHAKDDGEYQYPAKIYYH
jgi:hypothetical protein